MQKSLLGRAWGQTARSRLVQLGPWQVRPQSPHLEIGEDGPDPTGLCWSQTIRAEAGVDATAEAGVSGVGPGDLLREPAV